MGHKKLDMTEWLIHKHTHTYTPINTYVQTYIHIWMIQFTGKEGVFHFVLFHVRAYVCNCYWWERVSVQMRTLQEPHLPEQNKVPFWAHCLHLQNRLSFMLAHVRACYEHVSVPFWTYARLRDLYLDFPSVLEHGGCSADMSAYAWMFLSEWTLICSVRTNLCSLLVSLWDGVLINTSWFLEDEG